jgi:hypothetical protein
MTIPREGVAAILDRNVEAMIHDWIELVEQDEELASVSLNYDDRTVHLHSLFHDLVISVMPPPRIKSLDLPRREAPRQVTTRTGLQHSYDCR